MFFHFFSVEPTLFIVLFEFYMFYYTCGGHSLNFVCLYCYDCHNFLIIIFKTNFLSTVESPNKGHFGTNINSTGLSTV